jgi:glucokinase
MILAGDIGGTKRISPSNGSQSGSSRCGWKRFSADYPSLEEMLAEFLVHQNLRRGSTTASRRKTREVSPEEPKPQEPVKIDAACFGVAGPVIENHSHTTNLPWTIDGAGLAARFGIPHVRLLNDLEAMAYGILLLRPDELVTLNAGTPPRHKQAIALIAAGTGLGESILFWDGTKYRPMPSEGGHADFAPNSDNEIELLRHVRSHYLHVSYERVLSGPGLHAIYEYLRDTKKNEPTWLAEKIKAGDPAAEIAAAGLRAS